jgi:hypothetical protein
LLIFGLGTDQPTGCVNDRRLIKKRTRPFSGRAALGSVSRREECQMDTIL